MEGGESGGVDVLGWMVLMDGVWVEEEVGGRCREVGVVGRGRW